MQHIYIKTEYITLSAFLKFAGAVMSGGEAKEHIGGGRVFVNGSVCAQRGKKLVHGDIVTYAGTRYEVVRNVSDGAQL